MKEFAHSMKWLVYEVFSEVEIIRVILENFPTHKPSACYEIAPRLKPDGS
jgi:hypothetical protein